MTISDLIQGSVEWLEVRKKSVTSTDASIINGTNTFNGNSPFKLWQKKLGLIDEDPVTEIMTEGLIFEKEARDQYNKANKVKMEPKVVFHPDYSWCMASLDGFNDSLEYILEIKCGKRSYEMAEQNIVPKYYYDQIQHALFATGRSYCDYLCYRRDQKTITIPVERDDIHIEMLLEKEKKFYHCLENMISPECLDYVRVYDDDLENLELEWKKINERLKELKTKEKELRKQIIDFGDDGNFKGQYLKFTRILQIRIDYKKAALESKIDLTPFRKESIGYYRIAEIK